MKIKRVFIYAVLLSIVLCACGNNGIKTKWYMTNDDDFWMDISDSSISFYSVHTDELMAKADVSISSNEIVISNPDKLVKGARYLSEGFYTYEIEGDKLILRTGKYSDTFSTDIKYKRDH
ncbi:MAG: hypothetical protein IJM25_05785 [Eubacterium sp.]|nr:hypothetical protein [Eubacterium sp.]